jgi:hypothetical protein
VNARQKGASGERELADWLFRQQLVVRPPDRNLEQVRRGGIDLIPQDHPFLYEVKRVEGITFKTFDAWWAKANIDCTRHNRSSYEEREAVVAFRRNSEPWSFLINVEKLLGVIGSYAIVKAPTFIKYAQRRIIGYGDTTD